MDKKTYEALKLVMYNVKHYANSNCASSHLIHKAIKQVENWVDEVEKEHA